MAAALCLFAFSAGASTFTVDSLGDGSDAIPGDAICATSEGACTLRAAIEEANASVGPDAIAFAVNGTIVPSSDLPTIMQRTRIDGTTAPGYSGRPVITLDGTDTLGVGIRFGATAGASTLSGMKIIGFAASAMNIDASDVQVYDNAIGPIGGGSANYNGIVVAGAGNHIGAGTDHGNVISGNLHDGLVINGTAHRVIANRIGTTADGMSNFGNGGDGIKVNAEATEVIIGGETSLVDLDNVIAGNGDDGIDIDGASHITIGGNHIGSDVLGGATIANADHAIEMTNANDNLLSVPNDALLVSGHDATGIRIASGTGNIIGVTLVGDAAVISNDAEAEPAPIEALPVIAAAPRATTTIATAAALEPVRRAIPAPIAHARLVIEKREKREEPKPVQTVSVPAPVSAPLPAPSPARAVVTTSLARPAPVMMASRSESRAAGKAAAPAAIPTRSKIGLTFIVVGLTFAGVLRRFAQRARSAATS